MIGQLLSSIAIYLRLNIGKTSVSLRERICAHLPFSVYLGWIAIATIANVSVALTFAGWTGGGIALRILAVIVVANTR